MGKSHYRNMSGRKNVTTSHTSKYSSGVCFLILWSLTIKPVESSIGTVVFEETCSLSRQPASTITRLLSYHQSLTFCGSAWDKWERDVLFPNKGPKESVLKLKILSFSFPTQIIIQIPCLSLSEVLQ